MTEPVLVAGRYVDRVAVITGAASGMGAATARRLSAEGASLVLADLAEGPLTEITEELQAARPGSAVQVVADVSTPAGAESVIEAARNGFGRLDLVAHFAGILRSARAHEMELAEWEQVLRVNATGTFLICRAALPALVETKGSIVVTASLSAVKGHLWVSAYAASKGAVIALAKSLAVEYADTGVRVNAIAPGAIATPMTATFPLPAGLGPADYQRLTAQRAPLGAGAGRPEDVAGVVAMLGSADGAYMSGAVVAIDGAGGA